MTQELWVGFCETVGAGVIDKNYFGWGSGEIFNDPGDCGWRRTLGLECVEGCVDVNLRVIRVVESLVDDCDVA